MTDQMKMQDIASGSAYLILQATDTKYSPEYRIRLVDKATALIADLRDGLVLELTGSGGSGDAPPDAF